MTEWTAVEYSGSMRNGEFLY